MKRTQIYLDDTQDDRLGRRAEVEGTTKSALIRRAVDAYLAGGGDDDDELRLKRFRTAVDAVAGTAPDLPPGALYVDRRRAFDSRQRELERRCHA